MEDLALNQGGQNDHLVLVEFICPGPGHEIILLRIVVESREHPIHHILGISIYRHVVGRGKEQPLHTIARWNQLQDGIFGGVRELTWMFRILQEILLIEPDEPCPGKRMGYLLDAISFWYGHIKDIG